MENKKNIRYIKTNIIEHDVIVHIWIYTPLTKVECDVFELLVKGYKIANVAQYRARSLKTVSSQKHQVYKKLGFRNDVTFWIDIILSHHMRIVFCRNGKVIDTEKELLRMFDSH
ncbi:LuxR C-terminal-related transcriptional regulator [Escherichia coli]|uniref:LuxR C-terminal-related transcriptional regulator n=1 Tax=Escherichia coli TaxID=562 RepID=UPI0007E91BA2|nr:LuxR C-terminal-related transcriptional regulator [Escherichia coli]